MPTYRWGTPLKFGAYADSIRYQGKGWSEGEQGFTWTNGKRASLAIPIDKTESDIMLRATFLPFVVPGKLDRQRMNILANGKKVGAWVATTERGFWDKIRRKSLFQEKTIVIPNNLLEDSALAITFELPDAASPASLAVGEDVRTLGIAMHSIVLTELAADHQHGIADGGDTEKQEDRQEESEISGGRSQKI